LKKILRNQIGKNSAKSDRQIREYIRKTICVLGAKISSNSTSLWRYMYIL